MRKPSRAAVRVLTILSFIEGAIIEAGKQADPLIKSRVDYAQHHCKFAASEWRITGTEQGAIEGAIAAIKRIDEDLNKIWWLAASPSMNLPGMLYIGMQLLDDLMVLINNPTRQRWLQDVFDAMTVLVDYVDPEGAMYLTQDRAQEVVRTIYNVVGER